ncbi:CbrC family protein [Streptomyces sp. NPDC056333]|uniref:CbrC family protein n=1 Tax=Streptomyces sp. NPDC056333 TaxID=3345786 RepID=UPI0035E270FA
MSSQLPFFRYHPEPVTTGAVTASGEVCACCGQARGWIYTASFYTQQDVPGRICPWCIADGGAAERFNGEFADAYSLDGVSWEVLKSPAAPPASMPGKTPAGSSTARPGHHRTHLQHQPAGARDRKHGQLPAGLALLVRKRERPAPVGTGRQTGRPVRHTAAHACRRGGYDPSRTGPSPKRPESEGCRK